MIDGQQRLSTIFKFMGILKDYNLDIDEENEHITSEQEPLTRTKFLPSLEGKYWDKKDDTISLTDVQRRYIKRAKILIIIIDKSSDEFAQFEMFQRLNTGGSHLSPQEIRNCILVMKNESVYKIMKELSEYPAFRKAVPISEKDTEEQGYLELETKYFVLRHSKLVVSDSENYNNFLTDEILALINSEDIDFETEMSLFKCTFDLVQKSMDENAFKRYDKEKNKSVGTVLVGAFEAIIPGLTDNIVYYSKNEQILSDKIKAIYDQEDYILATKRGIRPVSRLKKLVDFSRENFGIGK